VSLSLSALPPLRKGEESYQKKEVSAFTVILLSYQPHYRGSEQQILPIVPC